MPKGAPKVLIAALALALAAPAPAFAQRTAFVSALEDVPLPMGFSEQGEPVVFETPAGRILQVQAEGSAGPSSVREYYALSLPQLGWTPLEDRFAFVRGGDTLEIDVSGTEDGARLAFRLIAGAPSLMAPDPAP